ncbi:MAG: hypothetical protein EOO38_24625 [Cytophagaceae bacterium]|jgi:hypothetical protein|nr:MAG: hypothetical protein EOO38_24625 [Cytophagaceae bacterium]
MRHYEERVIYLKRFQGRTFDFRDQLLFARYDECEFVRCTILMDHTTGSLAFTNCSFEECNLTELKSIADQSLFASGNNFKLPIEVRKANLHNRLIEAITANSKSQRLASVHWTAT